MIEYVKGGLVDLSPAFAVVEAHGVGYGMSISLNTFERIKGQPEVKLWVYEAMRDDACALYGFATREERSMFMMLIGVSGIGPNTARVMLSEMGVPELCEAIASADEKRLRAIKGIGARTAQRVIVDLRDKVAAGVCGGGEYSPSMSLESSSPVGSVREEALGALTMLGFAPASSAKVVGAILREQPSLPVEQVVKLALKHIR